MSDLAQIKQRIYREDRLKEILALLDCWNIKPEQNGNLYTAGLPDGDNSRSVQIKNNEYITSHIRSKGIDGDIFSIVSYIVYGCETEEDCKKNLHRSKYWLCNKLKYYEYIDDFYKLTVDSPTDQVKYTQWLVSLQKHRGISNNVNENKIYDESILNDFVICPSKKWIDEGLDYSTQIKFQIGFDVRSERIIFPIHNQHGNLVGVKGRYIGENSRIESDFKYIYLYSCNKSIELFNLHRALPHVMEKREIIIVEGAKTAMFLDQWGYKNTVSIEGDSLSYYQLRLLKNLGIGIKYIFGWDKDKDINFIKNQTRQLQGRLKYAIYDKNNLLSSKNSPHDKGRDIFKRLYEENNYRIGG
jgi:DNA primase